MKKVKKKERKRTTNERPSHIFYGGKLVMSNQKKTSINKVDFKHVNSNLSAAIKIIKLVYRNKFYMRWKEINSQAKISRIFSISLKLNQNQVKLTFSWPVYPFLTVSLSSTSLSKNKNLRRPYFRTNLERQMKDKDAMLLRDSCTRGS